MKEREREKEKKKEENFERNANNNPLLFMAQRPQHLRLDGDYCAAKRVFFKANL